MLFEEIKQGFDDLKEERKSKLALYPVYIHTDENGAVGGFAPGVFGLFFAGKDIEDCIKDAKSAFTGHFDLLIEDGQEIPSPTAVEQHLDDEDCKDGFWFMVEVDVSKYRGQNSIPDCVRPEFQVTIDTSDTASVWRELLNDDPIIAKNYMLRSALTSAITEQIKRRKLTNTDAARLLNISHTAVSVLLNGNMGDFNLDELVDIAHKLGYRICLDIAC